jgi:hypothetical protein
LPRAAAKILLKRHLEFIDPKINHFNNLQIINSKNPTKSFVKSQIHLTPSKQTTSPLQKSFHQPYKIELEIKKSPGQKAGVFTLPINPLERRFYPQPI